MAQENELSEVVSFNGTSATTALCSFADRPFDESSTNGSDSVAVTPDNAST